jgi:peptidyl-prolyl cis-trans isomerase B (cyclophilin B)
MIGTKIIIILIKSRLTDIKWRKNLFGKVSSKSGAKKITGEFSNNGWKKNKIKHVAGVISMARSKDYNSATSQFFICSATYPSLDGNYAAFGKTTDTKSKQVVINISKVETYAYSNSFTDMPVNVIKIKTVKLSNSKF